MLKNNWFKLNLILTLLFVFAVGAKLQTRVQKYFSEVTTINYSSLITAIENINEIDENISFKNQNIITLDRKNFKREKIKIISKVTSPIWTDLYESIELPHEVNNVASVVVAKVETKKQPTVIAKKNFDRISVKLSAPETSARKSVKLNIVTQSSFELTDYLKTDKQKFKSNEVATNRSFFNDKRNLREVVKVIKKIEISTKLNRKKLVLAQAIAQPENKNINDELINDGIIAQTGELEVSDEYSYLGTQVHSNLAPRIVNVERELIDNNIIKKEPISMSSSFKTYSKVTKTIKKDVVTTKQAKSLSVKKASNKLASYTSKKYKSKINNHLNIVDAKETEKKVENVPTTNEIQMLMADNKKANDPHFEKTEKQIEYTKGNLLNEKTSNIAELIIEPLVIRGKSDVGSIGKFQIEFDDNQEEIQASNSIILESEIASEIGIRRGTISSSEIIPVSADFVYEPGSIHSKFLTFSRDYMNRIVSELNINDDGAYILVELDDNTEDVEVDKSSSYSGKMYLDKTFKPVMPTESQYSYVLYVGVNPGNTIISFKTIENHITSKIIHIKHGELYVERNFYVDVDVDEFKLLEEKPLAKNPTSLNVQAKQIEPFGYSAKVNKKTIDQYSIFKSKIPLGTRKYYTLDNDLVFGRWNEENVLIPSSDYINMIYDKFNVSKLNGSCLIQVNLTKPVKEIAYTGYSDKGPLVYDFYSFDDDGEFYEEVGVETQKLFFLGQESNAFGMLNMKITYNDETVDYLQSFCSPDTYLLEQL